MQVSGREPERTWDHLRLLLAPLRLGAPV